MTNVLISRSLVKPFKLHLLAGSLQTTYTNHFPLSLCPEEVGPFCTSSLDDCMEATSMMIGRKKRAQCLSRWWSPRQHVFLAYKKESTLYISQSNKWIIRMAFWHVLFCKQYTTLSNVNSCVDNRNTKPILGKVRWLNVWPKGNILSSKNCPSDKKKYHQKCHTQKNHSIGNVHCWTLS